MATKISINSIQKSHQFNFFSTRLDIPIFSSNDNPLKSLDLAVWAQPSFIHGKPIHQMRGVDNLRIYIDEIDITRVVTEKIQKSIANQEENYIKGAKEFIEDATRLKDIGAKYDADMLTAKLEELINFNIISNYSFLGSINNGPMGILDPINFFHNFIKIGPNNKINLYNIVGAALRDKKWISKSHNLTISQGKILTKPVKDLSENYGGIINVSLEIGTQNSIYSDFDNLEKKFEALRSNDLPKLFSEVSAIKSNRLSYYKTLKAISPK